MGEGSETLHTNGQVTVRRGTDGENKVILKSYNLLADKIAQHELDSCTREIKFFEAQQSYQTKHPHESMPIGKIHSVSYAEGMIYLKMEDCGKKELDISRSFSWPAKKIKTKFGDVLKGVEFMHNELEYAHLDLKPMNIGESGKIFDYGESAPASKACGHDKCTEEYTHITHATYPAERTQTADLFALGATLLEMLGGKITPGTYPSVGQQAYGWELVEEGDVWKDRWRIGVKCFTCQGYGRCEVRNCKLHVLCPTCDGPNKKAGYDVVNPVRLLHENKIPKCLKAKDLVRALLVDFETIQFKDVGDRKGINTLYEAFKSCTCSNYCKPDSRRRLIERFIRASEYCISS